MAEYYGNRPTKDYFTLVSALDAKFSDAKVGSGKIDLFTLSTGFQQKERFEEQPQYAYRGAAEGSGIGQYGDTSAGGGGGGSNVTIEVVPEDICEFCCTYPCGSDFPPFSPGTIDFSMSDSGFQSHSIEVTGETLSTGFTFSSLESLSFSSFSGEVRTSEPPSSEWSWSWGHTSDPWGSGGQSFSSGSSHEQGSGYSQETESWGVPYDDDKCLCGFDTEDPATSKAESYNQAKNYAGSWNFQFDIDIMHELKEWTQCEAEDSEEDMEDGILDGLITRLVKEESGVQQRISNRIFVCPSMSTLPIGSVGGGGFGTWYNPVGGIGQGPLWRVYCLYVGDQKGGWEVEDEADEEFVGSSFALSDAVSVPGGGILQEDLPITVEIDCDFGATCCCELTDPFPWCSNNEGDACFYTHGTAGDCCGLCGPSNLYGVCNPDCNDWGGAFEVNPETPWTEAVCESNENCTWINEDCYCTNHPACCEECAGCKEWVNDCSMIKICKIPVWKDWAIDTTIKIFKPKIYVEIRIRHFNELIVQVSTTLGFKVVYEGGTAPPPESLPAGNYTGTIGEGTKFTYTMSPSGQAEVAGPPRDCTKQCTAWRVDTTKIVTSLISDSWDDFVNGGVAVGWGFPEDGQPMYYTWPGISVLNSTGPDTDEICWNCPGSYNLYIEGSDGGSTIEDHCGCAPAAANWYDGPHVEDECASDETCIKLNAHSFFGEVDPKTISLTPRCNSSSTEECKDLSGGQGAGL